MFTQPFIQAQVKENTSLAGQSSTSLAFPVTGEFPAQRASNAENASIWWRHHETKCLTSPYLLHRQSSFYNL